MEDVSRHQGVEWLRWRVRPLPAGGQLPFANGVHALQAGNRTAARPKGLESQHRPRQPVHGPMISLHNTIETLAVADGDPGVVDPGVALNGGRGISPLVNRDGLWTSVMTNHLAHDRGGCRQVTRLP